MFKDEKVPDNLVFGVFQLLATDVTGVRKSGYDSRQWSWIFLGDAGNTLIT